MKKSWSDLKRYAKRVKKLGKRVKLSLRLARPYQNKRKGGAGERWELISKELDDNDRSLLDVGSNLGMMTELFAARGGFALGVEPDARYVRRAQNRTRGSSSLGFVRQAIDPETVLTLPKFDVVFCLSVHHYWVPLYGEGTTWKIIGELLSRARNKVFFEPAGVKRKFGGAPLDFEDLDRNSIIEYNVKHLESVAALDQSVRVLGETPCRSKEPFRMMFLVERQPASRS